MIFTQMHDTLHSLSYKQIWVVIMSVNKTNTKHSTKLNVYNFLLLMFSSWQLNVRGCRPSTFNSTGKR